MENMTKHKLKVRFDELYEKYKTRFVADTAPKIIAYVALSELTKEMAKDIKEHATR